MNSPPRAKGWGFMTEITRENLLARGYKQSKPNEFLDKYDMLFQARVEDEVGIRYYLNFREWDWSKYNSPAPTSYDAEVHYDVGGYDAHIWVTTRITADTIEQAEEIALKVWQALGCPYYDRFFTKEEESHD